MASIELGDLEKKVIPNCKFIWSQKIINHAQSIIASCDTDIKIGDFFNECETKIKSLDKEAKIAWNNEIQRFGGDEFAYVWMIFSTCLHAPIKMSIKLETLSQIIIVGNIEIANVKNGKKIEKHLNTPKPIENIKVEEKEE